MTSCPDLGLLRATIDGEAEAPAHAATCPQCRTTLAELRRDAAVAAAAVATLALDEVRESPVTRGAWSGRLARVGAAAACLALAVGLVATPGGRSAAAAFLAAFRTERLAVVTVDPEQADEAFAGLESLGTVSGTPAEPQPVPDLAAARAVSGLDVAEIDPASLPANISPTRSEIMAAPASQVRVTLSRARAPELPEHLDGTTLVVNLPPVVAQMYVTDAEQEGVVVGEAGELTVDTEGGATLEEVRDYLLSLPSLPPETATQLRALQDWRTTLPIPVPLGEVAWSDTTVAGGPGLLFGDNSGVGSVVVWQRDGRIHGVGGTLTAEEVSRIADTVG